MTFLPRSAQTSMTAAPDFTPVGPSNSIFIATTAGNTGWILASAQKVRARRRLKGRIPLISVLLGITLYG
jgi:hypothetical protein